MPLQYQPQQLYDIPQYMDPELAHHGSYPTTVTPGQQPEKKSVMIDVQAFVRTRDALASAYIGLSQAIDRSVKAYVEHTSVVLASDASLNVSYLTQPFDQLAHTAQLAQQALISNGVAAEAKQETSDGDKKGKRKKRAYKQRDPNAPKRPLTAYFRYLQEQRGPLGKELAEKAGGQPQRPGDLSKVATQRWNALTEEEHRPYKEAYQRALKDYEKEVERYKAAGGKVDESALAVVAEDEVAGGAGLGEDAAGEDVVDGKAVVVEEEEEEEDDDSSSSEESSDEEEDEKEPTPPPPPPAPKTPKSAMKKSKKETPAVAPTPQFSSINTSEPTKPSSSPERKRKAAATPSADNATASEEPAKKKRGRKPNAEKVTAGADVIPSTAPPAPVAPMSSAEAMPPPSSEPSKKKKKRKSET
ncbi:hypothetical protein LTR78_007354 [Recurvomyces mirabilis]|uniref:HMG box domain-containing protein n=1 Tax=Recurvomyces mirabilis TaxID=574656 RepID=A0AAE0TSU6_9PEZI|nr:hypothetical protein LTR78_007354 [Recurvomyces mirabilis]KAK5155058.1 hypothetical protein LTS14_006013 [Recurvomyces mirabilis]